ncbi:MAG: alpha-amylase family glycosyl hydrolase, partial [bacterium]
MRINKLFLIISILSISLNSNAQKAWGVLASPIKLNVDTTQIFLSDYFPYGDEIDSFSTNTALTIKRISTHEILLIGTLPVKVSNIRFYTQDDNYDIPLIASDKENIQLNIQLAKAVTNLSIKGSFSNWTVMSNDIEAFGALPSKIWTINLKKINSGRHEYKLIGDGVELDPINSTIVSNGIGGTNAVLEVGKKSDKNISLRTNNFEGNKVIVESENIDGYNVYWNHKLIQVSNKRVNKIQFNIPSEALKVKRSHIRVYAYGMGKLSNDLLIPLEYGRVINTSSLIDRTDLHSQIMYFMMVDRFANGDKNNDVAYLEGVNEKANFLGGDIAGLEQKIKSSYFSELGFNTLWLSPIAQNPSGAWGYWNKSITTKFSAYHGYWPTSYSLVDKRFGSNEGFKKMISEAHNKDLNIVLDFVAHHIHTDHPLYKQHPDWVTTLYLPDGTLNTERWDEYRLTTWFDTFLPTLDFAKPEVNSVISDSVMFWV